MITHNNQGDTMSELKTAELEQQYAEHVRDLAQDFYDRCTRPHDHEYSGDNIADRDDLYDALHEDIDGDSWVIHTHKAQAVCLCSRNDGYSVDEGLVGPEQFQDGIPWGALAYGALYADVMDDLDYLFRTNDKDINDDSTWREEPEEEEDTTEAESES